MRFRYAHKLSTYFTVMSSYCALVFSGELSDLIVLLGFLGILASWFWEPPRIDFEWWSVAWTLLSLVVLIYTVMATISGGDFLLVGGEFLIYLLVAKLCNRRTCKDYLHVYLLAFLMLVAGTVLNTEFTYGFFFLGFVVSMTWAAILFHLRREMEDNYLLKHSEDMSYKRVQVERIMNSRRIVGRRFFVGTALVSLTVFGASALLFLAIPRVGWGMFFQNKRGGITMTGFSDGVRLGGHGLIKSDKTVVMRVYVDDAYEGRLAPYLHWRGVAFETYERGLWKRRRSAPETRRQVLRPSTRKTQHYMLYAKEIPSEAKRLARLGMSMRQEIYLEPLGADVLFGASMPTMFEFDVMPGSRRRVRAERNDEMRLTHSAGIKYVVYSAVQRPDTDVLRAAPVVIRQGYEAYLQIPPEITPEIRNLAVEITRNARTHYDKAVAVQNWLRSNLSYTLRMKSPGRTEPIHYFLFDRKKGHCEYFSSAMAILLRAVGVPTRNVNGFLGGEWNEYEDYIAVRAGDAHSWVEVYFEGVGWVTFDPTPPASIDRLGRGGSGIRERLRRLLDTLRFKWFKWVIDYDLQRQLSIFRDLRNWLSGGTTALRDALSATKEWIKEHRGPAIGVVIALLIGLALFLRTRWRRRRTGAGTRDWHRPRDAVAVVYHQVLARLARRGYRKAPATTPREFARELARDGTPGASALAELTELHYHVAYGSRPAAEALDAATEASAAIDRAFAEARRAAKKRGQSGGAGEPESSDDSDAGQGQGQDNAVANDVADAVAERAATGADAASQE